MTDRINTPACLAVIEVGVRGVLEEQFATILWLSLVLRRMRLPLDILLCRDAARLALSRPSVAAMSIGGVSVATPCYERDIERLLEAGARIFVLANDVEEERRAGREFVSGVEPLDRGAAAALIAHSQKAWFW